MNFFEQELKKIMDGSAVLKDQRYVGRICCGKIDNDIRGRVEFVTLGTSGNYGGIKISAINRKEGVIDSMLLRFSDIFGKKQVNNPNFKDGIVPHIWEDGGKREWYVYHPTAGDYRQLAGEIENYLGIFQEEAMDHTEGIQQVMQV